MRKIIDQKIYDTEKAEIIFEETFSEPIFWRKWTIIIFFVVIFFLYLYFGENVLYCFGFLFIIISNQDTRKIKRIYRTAKGNYFRYSSFWSFWLLGRNDNEYICPIYDDDEVKRWLVVNHPDVYKKHFGEIEEA